MSRAPARSAASATLRVLRTIMSGIGLNVGRVDDDVHVVQLERLAQVDGQRAAERRRRPQLGGDDVVARVDRLPANLRAEVPGAARDEDPHVG